MDTRKHTRHPLRPDKDAVEEYLAAPSSSAWKKFAKRYRTRLAERFAEDRAPFDEIVEAAGETDVWLGCSCPSRANPDVTRCHTYLALEFFAGRYPELEIRWPE